MTAAKFDTRFRTITIICTPIFLPQFEVRQTVGTQAARLPKLEGSVIQVIADNKKKCMDWTLSYKHSELFLAGEKIGFLLDLSIKIKINWNA